MHHDLLTISEVARMLRVEGVTVRRWVKTGAIEAIKLPKTGIRTHYRIRRSTVENILQSAHREEKN